MSLAAYLTNGAVTVLNKLMASKGPLAFTKAELGDGIALSETEARARTCLIHKVANAAFSGVEYGGGEARLSVQYVNTGLAAGFFVREIALFCLDPDNPATEILYCYATFGDHPDWIAAHSLSTYTRVYDIVTVIANVPEVTVKIAPSALVSREDFDRAVARLSAAVCEVTRFIHLVEAAKWVLSAARARYEYTIPCAEADEDCDAQVAVQGSMIGLAALSGGEITKGTVILISQTRPIQNYEVAVAVQRRGSSSSNASLAFGLLSTSVHEPDPPTSLWLPASD